MAYAIEYKRHYAVTAAIDFGTTYSGYAYSYLNSEKIFVNTDWVIEQSGGKTPTVILFNPDMEFDSFGYQAEEKYTSRRGIGDSHQWYYFHRFKMVLHNLKTVTMDMELQAMNGCNMKAITVFSESIRYLKDHLMKQHKHRYSKNIEVCEIFWVLTVPAIWDENSKQFMRKAAEWAGIPSQNLAIGLEPECGAIFCRTLPLSKHVDNWGNPLQYTAVGTKYMVIDNGGGTSDIAVHELVYSKEGTKLQEIHKTSGGHWGGTMVDKEFLRLLSGIFGKRVMERFENEFHTEWVEFLRFFETKKKSIRLDGDMQFVIQIPHCLSEVYKECNENASPTEAMKNYRGCRIEPIGAYADRMGIPHHTMLDMIQGRAKEVANHVRSIYSSIQADHKLDFIYMVGGFSNSDILVQAIRDVFPNIPVIVPEEAELAILKGAVLFGKNPSQISARRSRRTYGVDTYTKFIKGVHQTSRVENTQCGERVEIFDRFVMVDESIELGQVVEKSYRVRRDDQTSIAFNLYGSDDECSGVVYSDDRRLRNLGSVTIHVSGTGLDRGAKGKMYFGDTELRFTARETDANGRETGREAYGTFDFLTRPGH